jgi:hypothetical protein
MERFLDFRQKNWSHYKARSKPFARIDYETLQSIIKNDVRVSSCKDSIRFEKKNQ